MVTITRAPRAGEVGVPVHIDTERGHLRFAIPKGRLLESTLAWFRTMGYDIARPNSSPNGSPNGSRQLHIRDSEGRIDLLLVKNSDLPTYLQYGVAGLGICGDDLLYEANTPLVKLARLPFGATRLCLAGRKGSQIHSRQRIRVASSYTRATADYFHAQNIPVDVIELNGSVEIAVLTNLAPYIVDLVDTGETLRAHNLHILEEIKNISVYLVANPAYYKYHYFSIQNFLNGA